MYRANFEQRRDKIDQWLWDERYGTWYDYDTQKKERRRAFYASNFMPLFARCYKNEKQVEKVLKHIDKVSG